jgi:ABC-2 type transport system ATP-binding protein
VTPSSPHGGVAAVSGHADVAPSARHAEVRRVLHQVGLSNLATKRIRAMSGGQRRRIALAQTLLGSPPVLILDEPTSGVDPEQRVTWRTVLAEIARTSIVVLSTHQTEDVAALCERIIVLDQGRVRYDGQVTELVRQAAGQPDPAASCRTAGRPRKWRHDHDARARPS